MDKNKLVNKKIPLISIKLTKIKELEDALHPNNIEENWSETFLIPSIWFNPPTIGERFKLGSFNTSGVQKIIDENTFETYSIVYKWEKMK